MHRPRPRLVVLLLLLGACGPGDSSSTDTADMSTDTSGTAPTGTTDTPEPTNLLECAAPSVCGVVLANSGDPGVPTPTAYTQAQACALQQLAAAGSQRLHYSDGCEGMCYGALILIRGDGSAIAQPYEGVFEGGVDLDGIKAELAPFADSQLCTLREPAYYEACLAAFDNACTSRSNWFDGCTRPAPAACGP